jgi:hypothetical protein
VRGELPAQKRLRAEAAQRGRIRVEIHAVALAIAFGKPIIRLQLTLCALPAG